MLNLKVLLRRIKRDIHRQYSDLKNKMSDDIRILFTEYRQKRKGNFSSTTRRANDLKQ